MIYLSKKHKNNASIYVQAWTLTQDNKWCKHGRLHKIINGASVHACTKKRKISEIFMVLFLIYLNKNSYF
ncbi:MAG: hypothetical protein EAZ44_03555 [Cytophagia bacterium]|nr:MAG: hypothetical protein EAZ44_03555 [Cytophagia bacterium]TAG42504.1 MAG: hypothetical protein EAZ31_05985 [Cytophagia bacterium]